MRLDVEKTRKAGQDVLAAKDKLLADLTAASLRDGANGLQGLALADALVNAADIYEACVRRFGDQHDFIGHTVVELANKAEATDEDAGAEFKKLDAQG